MATSTPNVRVCQAEAGLGFVVTCTSCPNFRTVRLMRRDADLAAASHLRGHGTNLTGEED